MRRFLEQEGVDPVTIARERMFGIMWDPTENVMNEKILKEHEGTETDEFNVLRLRSENPLFVGTFKTFLDFIFIERDRENHTLLTLGAKIDEMAGQNKDIKAQKFHEINSAVRYRIQDDTGGQWTLVGVVADIQEDGAIKSIFDNELRIVTLNTKTGNFNWQDTKLPPLEKVRTNQRIKVPAGV